MRALTSFTQEIERELVQDKPAPAGPVERFERALSKGQEQEARTDEPPSGPRPDPTPGPFAATPAATSTAPAAPAGVDPSAAEPLGENPALLELRLSPLGADLDQIGDRIVIRADQVEVRDRNLAARHVIRMSEITSAVIARKITGAVLTITGSGGQTIVAKGVRPDLAEEARELLDRLTGGLADPPETTRRSRSSGETELLRKLNDLHRAGILTDAELEEKKELVARLARGEELTRLSR
jgi:hypothetical protein